MNFRVVGLLLVIFVFAYFLRVMFLGQLGLTFGYDQARDALIARQILGGDLKILGPPSSTPGLYHGVFWFYFLSPAYWVGQGSPVVAAYWNAFWNAFVVFIVFALGYFLTKEVWAGLLSSVIFAVSFEATQYATWLSNPTIGVWTVPLAYLGLWMWLTHSTDSAGALRASSGRAGRWGAVLAGLGLGLSVQANIFLSYHIPPFALWLLIARKNLKISDWTKFIATFVLVISSMLVSEVKFGFKSLSGIWALASSQDAIVVSKKFGDLVVLYLNQLGRVFSFNVYPGNVGYGAGFVMILLVFAIYSWNKKEKIAWQPFLATWILSHVAVVSVGGTSTPFLLVGIGSAVALLLGVSLYTLWSRGKKILVFAILFVVVLGNLSMIFRENYKGQTIFAIQKDMVLKKQLAAIDYTYQEADGEPFSINSLTSPLWINIVWTYLYEWYGLEKYGYVPQWHGRDQVGQLASLSKAEFQTERYFLILEPMAGIPRRYLDETIVEENLRSRLVDEVYFGELRVQKRVKLEGAGSI